MQAAPWWGHMFIFLEQCQQSHVRHIVSCWWRRPKCPMEACKKGSELLDSPSNMGPGTDSSYPNSSPGRSSGMGLYASRYLMPLMQAVALQSSCFSLSAGTTGVLDVASSGIVTFRPSAPSLYVIRQRLSIGNVQGWQKNQLLEHTSLLRV